MYWNSKRPITKVVSIVTILTFVLTNTSYAVPSSRSLFKDKKVDHERLSAQQEERLQKKRSIFKSEDVKAKGRKKETKRILTSHLKDLSQIHIPSEIGKVVEVYHVPDKTNNNRLVVHIQDLHTNPEAQLNLAGILEILIKDYNLDLVCSEGADGEVDTSSVSSFPDYEVREKTARLFIDSGELTGEEYLSITKYPDLPIWGIEDRDIYFKNIIEFNKIIKFSPSSQGFISQAKEALDKLKEKVYSRELKTVDQKETDYENEKIETDEYLRFLSSYIQRFNIPTSRYKNISILNEAAEQEGTIDQVKIMKESQDLLLNLQAELVNKSSKRDLDSLKVKAGLFKDQKISPFSFYSYLKDLALRHLPDQRERYPNLNDFVDYLSKVNSLDATKLFNEMTDLTYEVRQRLSRTEEEKTLVKALRNIKFLEGFFNLKVSNEELDYYLANKTSHKVGFFKSFLEPSLKKHNIPTFIDYNPDLIDSHLKVLEVFYQTVKKRDIAMVRNALSEIERRDAKVSAFISGGFHTKGITRLLREKGYSYIVVSPYSSTDIDEENYHFLLSGQRKPITELLNQFDLSEVVEGLSTSLRVRLRVPLSFDADMREAFNKSVAGGLIGKIEDIASRLVAAIVVAGARELKRWKTPVWDISVRRDPTTKTSIFSIRAKNQKGATYIRLTNDGKAALTDEREFTGAGVLIADISTEPGRVVDRVAAQVEEGTRLASNQGLGDKAKRPRLNAREAMLDAIERLAGVLEGEEKIFNKNVAAEAIIQDLMTSLGLGTRELQDIEFSLSRGITSRTGRDVRYLEVSAPERSTAYVIKNSAGIHPEWEFDASILASELGLGPQFVYSEAGKKNRYLDIIIEARLVNAKELSKEEELLVGRRLAEKIYTMLDASKKTIAHGFDALPEHIRIVKEGEDIDVRFIDWGKHLYVNDGTRLYAAEDRISAIISEIHSFGVTGYFKNPEVVLAAFISRLKEIALQRSEEELDFYNGLLDDVHNGLTNSKTISGRIFNEKFKVLYREAEPLIGEIDARLGAFSPVGNTVRAVKKAMKTFKGWLEKGWTIANHILVSFHVAFIGSILSLPPDVAGKGETLRFMFTSPETIVSLGFLWAVWHAAISIHEMGHYITAVKVDALNAKLLPEAKKMMYESGRFRRWFWYAKMFMLIPYGKFKGVIKTGLSYHPDAEYNLYQTAAGPRFSRNMAIVFAPVALTLLVAGLTGGFGSAIYAGRLALGLTAVPALDYFLADSGEFKKLRDREHLARVRAEEAKKKAEKAGRWIDLVADVKKRMMETRMQKVRTRDGLWIWAPWQFRNSGMGGQHTKSQYPESNISMQETMFNPLSPKNYEEAQEMTIKLQTRLAEIIQGAEGCRVMGIGLEGGLAPYITIEEGDVVPEQRLWRMAKQAILDCGYVPGVDVAIALDPASSELQNAYREEMGDPDAIGMYLFWRDKAKVVMNRDELYEFFRKTIEEDDIPIVSIEDGFAEDDDKGWALIKKELGDKIFIIGDDSVTTKDSSIEYGADNDLNNTFLCKANQIGTLSETLLAILVALGKDLDIVVSHRSKSPNDDMEAHIALASFAVGLKTGGGANTERLFKYGAVMRIMAQAVRAAQAVIEEMPEEERQEILASEKLAEDLMNRLVITEVIGWEESTNAGIPTVKIRVAFGIRGSEKFKRFFVFEGSTPLGTSAGTDEAIHLTDSVVYENQIPDGKYRVLFDQKPDGSYRFTKDVTQEQIDGYGDDNLSELYRRSQRYNGKGNLNAVDYANTILAEEFTGLRLEELGDLVDIDRRLLVLEREVALERGQLTATSTEEEKIQVMQRKGNIGMNAILSQSLAAARLVAHLQGKELYQVLREKLEETMARIIAENGGLDTLPKEIRRKVSVKKGQELWQALNEDLDFFELKAGLQAVDNAKPDDVKLYELLREQLPVYKKSELKTTAKAPKGGGITLPQLKERILKAESGDQEAIKFLEAYEKDNPELFRDQVSALEAQIAKASSDIGPKTGGDRLTKLTQKQQLTEVKLTPRLFDGRNLLRRDNKAALEEFDEKIAMIRPDEVAVILIKGSDSKEQELKEYFSKFGERVIVLNVNNLTTDTEVYNYFSDILTNSNYKIELLGDGLTLEDAIKYLNKV